MSLVIPPVQRSAALAAGALNAAATTVDQHVVWTSAGMQAFLQKKLPPRAGS